MKLRSFLFAAFLFIALPLASSFAQVGRIGQYCAATSGGRSATARSSWRLHLESRLLGLWKRGLLLGSRRLGRSARSRSTLDSAVVGLEQRDLRL